MKFSARPEYRLKKEYGVNRSKTDDIQAFFRTDSNYKYTGKYCNIKDFRQHLQGHHIICEDCKYMFRG